jgi:hypothetical protein
VTDTVWGTFFWEDPVTHLPVLREALAAGAELHWFLLQDNPTTQAWVASHSGWLTPGALIASALTLPPATFAQFVADVNPPVTPTHEIGTTGPAGTNTMTIVADGEEPVLVLVIPSYPVIGPVTEFPTKIEWTKINFWTYEMEKVPQVRWAGEKIVLQKYFGPGFYNHLVRFSLENQSPGALEGLNGTSLGNLNNSAQTVWDVVDNEGYADVMLVSEAPGEVDVDLALYDQTLPGGIRLKPGTNDPEGPVLNQHGFVVFYLKLEDITLGNVVGKRATHNSGLWTPPNPWDSSLDVTQAILNVSQDDLLRARVRGWFVGDNLSARPARTVDADPTVDTGDPLGGTIPDGNPANDADMVLPAGRWILPDDWPRLAGPDWREQRIHWDIMDNPFDSIKSASNDPGVTWTPPASAWGFTNGDNAGLGNYWKYNSLTGSTKVSLVAAYPVVGPFTPSTEVPTSFGYAAPIAPFIPDIAGIPLMKSVVPNGELEWWDAPMPPAKITFKILDATVNVAGLDVGNAGFFKDAWKADIYYVIVSGVKYYTNPFYWIMIPASPYIPAFVNNGGYDWNSWNLTSYGPYPFWKIVNRPVTATDPTEVPSTDSANHPTKVQVYSDNHGEAMVFLNGNWNLNPDLFTFKGLDIPFGSTVGSSTVVAMADYPYFRKHSKLVSGTVTKTWTWGGMVLGGSTDQMVLSVGNYSIANKTGFFPNESSTSNDKMVFIWATDRDGKQAGVLGTQVDWSVAGGAKIPPVNAPGDGVNGVSSYNNVTKGIGLTNGFLNGTGGILTGSLDGTQGRSWMRAPNAAEKLLFNKFWGVGGSNPKLGADGQPANPDNFVVAAIDLLDATQATNNTVTEILTGPDFGTLAYFTTVNFALSHPLDDAPKFGDANVDGKVNMADITAIERIILGLSKGNINADANNNNKINMGDVVKTERTILGLLN